MTTYFIFNKTLDIFPINCFHSKFFIRVGYILYVQCVSSVNDPVLRTISRARRENIRLWKLNSTHEKNTDITYITLI